MQRSDGIFFLSGAAALAYEVIWSRLLARLLGGHAEATAVVLATFMGGLGLGALLLAGPAARAASPRRLFALLCTATAGWAALSPWILEALAPVEGLAPRLVMAAAVLLPPTIAMGGTFPLMGRLVGAGSEGLGRATAGFYGANTLGACAGALLAPFVLMPQLGLKGALLAAALLDLAAAALVLRLPDPGRAATPTPSAPAAPLAAGLLAVPFALGFSGLALEVLATRLLIHVTGASVYAFSLVLAVFLLGIGLGGRQARDLLREPGSGERLLLRCAVLAPALGLLGLLLLRWQLGERDLFGTLSNLAPRSAGVMRLWALHALLAALALLPVTVCLGMALPAAAAAAGERARGALAERLLGRVYAANTAGALAGALTAGFVLLPLVGPRLGVVAALAPCLLAALLLRGPSVRLASLGLAAGAALALPALGRPGTNTHVLALLHGRDATIAVEQRVEPGGAKVRSFRVNGKVEATTAPVDVRLQRLLAAIPAQLHGSVRSALVIGMGSGMTAGTLLALPSLERLDVFELEPRVADAARLFAEYNLQLLDDPRTRVSTGDGRHRLALSGQKWDLISADPLHPWTRGSSDLFAREHFEAMAAHLAPGGVASQWLPLYELSTLDVRTVVASWLAAFPHASAWLTAYDLALVGSLAPVGHELHQRAWPPRLETILVQVGVHAPSELQALLVADDAALRSWAGDAVPMTYDRPVLEFRAPRSYLLGYSTEVLAWAGRPGFLAELPAEVRPRAIQVRELLAGFLQDLPSGLSAAASSYGRALVELPPAGAPGR